MTVLKTAIIDHCFYCQKHTKFNNQWCQECGRSSNRVSDDELECVRENKCPDCKSQDLIAKGPSAGLCVNVMCTECESKFNITPLGIERID